MKRYTLYTLLVASLFCLALVQCIDYDGEELFDLNAPIDDPIDKINKKNDDEIAKRYEDMLEEGETMFGLFGDAFNNPDDF